MMEFLRANSIWDSILLLLPFYTFRFVVVILRCLRFVSSIHVVSECDWMSDCFTIPNVCIYILQTRRALQQQKLNFRRCTSFFPAFYTLFTLFSSFYYIWFFFFTECVDFEFVSFFNRTHILFCFVFVLLFFFFAPDVLSFFITIVNRTFRNYGAKTSKEEKKKNTKTAMERKENRFGAGKQTHF